MAELTFTNDKKEISSINDQIEKQYITVGEFLQNYIANEAKKNDKTIKTRDVMAAQRGFSWNKDKKRASNLILSILLRNIPIPQITLFREDDRGQYKKVLNGQQRLTSIYLFTHDGFKLDLSKSLIRKFKIEDKEYSVDDLQDKSFSELPQLWQDIILTSSIDTITFNNCSEEQAELLFAIYAEGEMPLRAIEIRRAKMGSAVRSVLLSNLNNKWIRHALTIGTINGNAGLDYMSQIVSLIHKNEAIEMSKENIDNIIYEFRDNGGISENIQIVLKNINGYLNNVTDKWIEIKKVEDEKHVKGRRVKDYGIYHFPFLNKTNTVMLMWAAKQSIENGVNEDIFSQWSYNFFQNPNEKYKTALGDRKVKVTDLNSVKARMQAIDEEILKLIG